MDPAEFKRVLDLGLGRAILYLREHVATSYHAAIVHACGHDTAYDAQVEGSRAEYLFEVLQATGKPNVYLDELLLTTTDAHTGLRRTVSLTYVADGDRHAVSAGASAANPAWYHNVLTHPAVTIEVGAAVLDAVARIGVGAERDAWFERFAAEQPQLVAYQAEASR